MSCKIEDIGFPLATFFKTLIWADSVWLTSDRSCLWYWSHDLIVLHPAYGSSILHVLQMLSCNPPSTSDDYLQKVSDRHTDDPTRHKGQSIPHFSCRSCRSLARPAAVDVTWSLQLIDPFSSSSNCGEFYAHEMAWMYRKRVHKLAPTLESLKAWLLRTVYDGPMDRVSNCYERHASCCPSVLGDLLGVLEF